MPFQVRTMTRTCAPIALFVYNRLAHTRKTVEALQNNFLARDSDLIIFSDAPSKPATTASVQSVREYIKTVDGFRSVTIVRRPVNMKLAASIVDGVSRVCAEYGRLIVLEDDLVTSRHFLTFMNDALDFYADDERVISVHGYMFPVGGALPQTFFLRDPGCWGWATWKRGWDMFNQDGDAILAKIRSRGLEREFNLDGSYDYLDMLRSRIAGKNNSWAIFWYASAFLDGKLTLYPGRSLVQNIGNDGSGTHSGNNERFETGLAGEAVTVRSIDVEESRAVRDRLAAFLRASRPSYIRQFSGALRARFRFS